MVGNSQPPVICLMGPTACGKTRIAMQLATCFPCSIVSVDSALVYRGMNIGTAKPTKEEEAKAPHHLINIRDPKDCYSAAQFREDALQVIDGILADSRIPLLVGGTMLYFRALQKGLSPLPNADPLVRDQISVQAAKMGWPKMHEHLHEVDPVAAERIKPTDSQRIQRALEVYTLTGKPLSAFFDAQKQVVLPYEFCNIGLIPSDRSLLHKRVARRFDKMLDDGLVEEVKQFYQRGDLSRELPAMRAVGYRHVWDYLDGKMEFNEMRAKAIAATRQLAKRQMTWLRKWEPLHRFDSEAPNVFEQVCALINRLYGW